MIDFNTFLNQWRLLMMICVWSFSGTVLYLKHLAYPCYKEPANLTDGMQKKIDKRTIKR